MNSTHWRNSKQKYSYKARYVNKKKYKMFKIPGCPPPNGWPDPSSQKLNRNFAEDAFKVHKFLTF